MRLIGYLSHEKHALQFSNLLNKYGIVHEIEASKDVDWGSPEYGTSQFKVWVVDEDQLDKAVQLYEEFQQDPDNPKYATDGVKTRQYIETEEPSPKVINIGRDYGYIKVRAPVNTYMIIACFLVFILTNLLQPTHTIVSRQAPLAPLFASPVRQILMYDYPLKYEILNQLIAEYGVDALTLPANLSQAAQSKIQKFLQTPYWEGIYGNLITNRANSQLSWFSDAPLFEKIRQGEIWRLVTPIFLHGDLIHIFFNMIWLYVIGKQLALNIGSFRYLIFVILTAAFSNTAQYLMTGANFLGFSGVICAMLTFIWTRQKIAPWEFYPLQNTTFIFMMIFVFGMAAFQTLSFLSEMTVQVSFAPGIANTAHISGLLAGLALGRLNFFAGKS